MNTADTKDKRHASPLELLLSSEESAEAKRRAQAWLGDIRRMVKTQHFSQLKRALVVVGIGAGVCSRLSGCLSPSQQSDWRWRRYNPVYRPPYPQDPNLFRPSMF